jgi:hypothetical protein
VLELPQPRRSDSRDQNWYMASAKLTWPSCSVSQVTRDSQIGGGYFMRSVQNQMTRMRNTGSHKCDFPATRGLPTVCSDIVRLEFYVGKQWTLTVK